MKQQCLEKWNSNLFWELVDPPEIIIPGHLDWVEYEEYMKAILLDCTPGQLGRLLVDFPANSTEDNRLHTHPASDRRVTVIKGSGDFICYRNKKVQTFFLVRGVRVWMPRGILHTFKSGSEGLLVESLHNPFVPLEHPKCLVYPKLAIGVN
jgi:hypothetical protein